MELPQPGRGVALGGARASRVDATAIELYDRLDADYLVETNNGGRVPGQRDRDGDLMAT